MHNLESIADLESKHSLLEFEKPVRLDNENVDRHAYHRYSRKGSNKRM